MSFTKFDNITRSALWSSYNYTCFYCNMPLAWDELHIDHIIPEYFTKDSLEFAKLKVEYELSCDFNANLLYNLVPAHARCNTRKGKELFVKATALFYLQLTCRRVPKIEAELKKLKNRKSKV